MKKEDKEKIKEISIRGRYAIGLVCLERVLKNFNFSTYELENLMNELWQVTSSEKLGAWQHFLIENNPKGIIADYQIIKKGKISFQQAGFETIKTEIDLENKFQVFKILPNPIINIFDNLVEIANSSLFGGCGEFSPITYKYTIDLLEIVEDLTNVEIPKIDSFTFSKFTQNHGWGDKFKKGEIKNY